MKTLSFALLIICLLQGCKKDAPNIPQPRPVELDDARSILLQSVIEQGMAPQYKFVYDSAQYVTQINYSDGFSIYTVEHENKRVKKLTNTFFHSYLLYQYSNGLLTRLDEYDATHHKIQDYQLLYNIAGKLIEVIRKQYNDGLEGILYKKEKLTYAADGNLASIEQYRLINDTIKLFQTIHYSQYDTQINVDDFYKLHGFWETFLYLPQVKLQANNPGKELIVNEANSFEITYTYQFINQLPIKKTGVMKQLSGTGSGQVFTFTNNFTYY